MFKLVLFVLVAILSSALSQDDAAKMEMFKKLVAAICVPNLPADKAKIVADCENLMPKTVRDVYTACAKQALGVPQVTLPIFCYKSFPNADKFTQCLKEREDEAAAQGVVIDPKQKEEFKNKYMGCMAKAV